MRPATRDRLLLLAVVSTLGFATIWAATFVIETGERGHQIAHDLFLRFDPGRAALFNQAAFPEGRGASPSFLDPFFPGPPPGSTFDVRSVPGLGYQNTFEYRSVRWPDGSDSWSFDLAIPRVFRAFWYVARARTPVAFRFAVWSVDGSLLIPTALSALVAWRLARRRRRPDLQPPTSAVPPESNGPKAEECPS